MGASLPADFNFAPKVWKDHIMAYFDKKLTFGAFAMTDRTLTGAPGTTIDMPFYKQIGDAETLAADEALTVDPLQDDSFNAVIKEVGKAVGIRDAALRKSAAGREKSFVEVQRQIGRRFAEKVDADLVTELNLPSSHDSGFVSTSGTENMNISRILRAKVKAFGDKHSEAVAIFMHSLHFLDMMSDAGTGFLKADANDPLWRLPGFEGRLLGMAIVTTDQVPAAVAIGGKQTYEAFIIKENSYGFMVAEEPEIETDRDILHREWIWAGTQWYAVKGFHKKIATDDRKVARMTVATSEAP